jgi:hypothetical protein
MVLRRPQSFSRCFQVSSTPFLARLQVIPLSPFVPRVDKQNRFAITLGLEFRDCRFQSAAKCLRGAIHNDHAVLAPPRCIVPAYKNAWNGRKRPGIGRHSIARLSIVIHLKAAAGHSEAEIAPKLLQAEVIVECPWKNSKLGLKLERGVEAVTPKVPAEAMRVDSDQIWVLIAALCANLTEFVGYPSRLW